MENPPVDHEVLHERLSKLATLWSMLASVNDGDGTDEVSFRLEFAHRYQRAAYRFLLTTLGNVDLVDDLFQEGVLRFVSGDSGEVDPQELSPREYLRVTLSAMVGAQHESALAQPRHTERSPSPSNLAHSRQDDRRQFLHCWREELLERAWEDLKQAEHQGGPPYYSLLRYRAEHPEESSSEIALEITMAKKLHPALSAHDLREMLQRARQQYADHLLDQVTKSLPPASGSDPTRIESELSELDLLRYCRGALQRRNR